MRWFAINRKHVPYHFALDAEEGWKASFRVAYSYCVECKTRSSSTGSDHKHSSNASDVLLFHAKRTSFSHSKRTATKHARKIPCLEYVGRWAGRFACCFIKVKGCDIERVGIVAVEKTGKTRRNFSEVTNAFKNGMCFAVNLIFQLAGYCFRRKILLFPKGLGMIECA